MKEKLFEHIGGNQFKLREDIDPLTPEENPEWEKDQPAFDWDKNQGYSAEKKFTVTVDDKKYDYFVTPMPDGDLNHFIADANGSLVSLGQGYDPKKELTTQEVEAEVRKFLAQPKKEPKPINLNAPPRRRFGGDYRVGA